MGRDPRVPNGNSRLDPAGPCGPHHKTEHHDVRQTIEAIIWRCQNRAKWRSLSAELGAWWKAAQTFIRWAKVSKVSPVAAGLVACLPDAAGWIVADKGCASYAFRDLGWNSGALGDPVQKQRGASCLPVLDP